MIQRSQQSVNAPLVRGRSIARLRLLKARLFTPLCLLCALLASCGDSSPGDSGYGTPGGGGSSASLPRAVDKTEREVAAELRGFVEALERAKNTANPLQVAEPDSEQFKKRLGELLDPLVGEVFELETFVAGFRQVDDTVLVALMDGAWWERFPSPQSPAIRFRLDSEDCIEIALETHAEEFEEGDYLGFAERFGETMGIRGIMPLAGALSPANLVAVAGIDIDLETARRLDIDSSYTARVRVTGWSGVHESPGTGNFMSMLLAAEDPDIARLVAAAGMPYIALECEWVKPEQAP